MIVKGTMGKNLNTSKTLLSYLAYPICVAKRGEQGVEEKKKEQFR